MQVAERYLWAQVGTLSMVLKDRQLSTRDGILAEWGRPQPILIDRWGASYTGLICRWSLSYKRWETDWRLQLQPWSWVWDETPWVDALLPRFGGLAERWMLLQWIRKVCNGDLEEIQDGGLQAYGHTSSFQLEKDWCIRIRRIWSYFVLLAYRITHVSGQHTARH